MDDIGLESGGFEKQGQRPCHRSKVSSATCHSSNPVPFRVSLLDEIRQDAEIAVSPLSDPSSTTLSVDEAERISSIIS